MPTKPLALSLTREEFHTLLSVSDGKRARVSVARALLRKLVMDHGRVIARLSDAGIATTEPNEEIEDEFAAHV